MSGIPSHFDMSDALAPAENSCDHCHDVQADAYHDYHGKTLCTTCYMEMTT